MAEIKLYTYFRSSASFRVRIGLYLKNIPFTSIPVHLVKGGGEQHLSTYRRLNPQGEVPSIEHRGQVISQSMAILQYLDQLWPLPSLFPASPAERAKVIQACEIVNSGIQPLQNLKVLQHLQNHFGFHQDQTKDWARHWIENGLTAIEKILTETSGSYCFGGTITAADLYLIPQVVSSQRFAVNLSAYPNIQKVFQNCMKLEAFKKSEPSAQPDFQP